MLTPEITQMLNRLATGESPTVPSNTANVAREPQLHITGIDEYLQQVIVACGGEGPKMITALLAQVIRNQTEILMEMRGELPPPLNPEPSTNGTSRRTKKKAKSKGTRTRKRNR